MAGDERVRHCTACDLNVYNFASMTAAEIRELLARTEGRVCGRLYQRADGTILTRDCPSGIQALRRRFSRWGSAAAAVLFGIATFSTGCATPRNQRVKLERATRAQGPLFTGFVHDGDGQALPGVTVRLRDQSRREFAAYTDANGRFALPDVPAGTYRVEVSLGILDPLVLKRMALDPAVVTSADITLTTVVTENIIVGAIEVHDTMTNGISTTFSSDFIEKMPR